MPADISAQTLDHKLARRVCARYADSLFKLVGYVSGSPDLEKLMMAVGPGESRVFNEELNRKYLDSLAVMFMKAYNAKRATQDITDILDGAKQETMADEEFFSAVDRFALGGSTRLRDVYFEDKRRAIVLGYGYDIVLMYQKKEENLMRERDKAVNERQEMKKKLGYARLQKIFLGAGLAVTAAAALATLASVVYFVFYKTPEFEKKAMYQVNEGFTREGRLVRNQLSNESEKMRKQISDESEKMRKLVKENMHLGFSACFETVKKIFPGLEEEEFEKIFNDCGEKPKSKKE